AFSTTLVLRTRVARADGTLGPPADVRFGNYDFASLVMADFNGDGFPDLAGNYRGDRGNVNPGNPDPNYAGGRIYLFFGQGDGTFPDVQIVEAEAPQGLAVADFNGDHRPDLVTANYNRDAATVYLGRGDGTFADPVSYPLGRLRATDVTAADFD